MASFVHIADERHAASIRGNGLKLAKQAVAVFALPVIENFVISHQWLRELKRTGFNAAVGVYFKIPDSELVLAGKYSQEKKPMTAAQAVAELRANETMGFEVLIPRSIKATDIKYIRTLPQTLGWRYFPEAKGKPPFCGCSYCQRGNIKSRKIKARYDSANTPLEFTR
jgi:hypothetical protein